MKKGGKKAPRKSKAIIISPELDLFELPEESKEKEIETRNTETDFSLQKDYI